MVFGLACEAVAGQTPREAEQKSFLVTFFQKSNCFLLSVGSKFRSKILSADYADLRRLYAEARLGKSA
jgi:hypothetical protein